MAQFLIRPEGMPQTNGYSHVVATSGNLLIISGQVPIDAEGRLVGPDDMRAQTRQVFHNLQLALFSAGARVSDLVKLTVFLTNMGDLADFRLVRDDFVDPYNPPASSLVQVSGLVHPSFRIEVEALAELPR